MFYIYLHNGLPREIASEHPKGAPWADHDHKGSGWISSRDFRTFEQAKRMAGYLSFMTGATYLPVDEGESVSPRYRVIKAPVIGDDVSRSFNGDSYPCGKIVKITPTWQVTTDQGTKFRRYKETGGWREAGRGSWMIAGIHNERNPHF